MFRKISYILLIIFISICLVGCGNNSDKTDTTNSNDNILTKKELYNLTNIDLESRSTNISYGQGTIYNILNISIDNPSLMTKKNFSTFLKELIDLEFNLLNYNDLTGIETKWKVDFYNATTDEITHLENLLRKNSFISSVTSHKDFVPSLNTPENRTKLSNAMEDSFQEGDEFDDPSKLTGSGSWHFQYLGLTDMINNGINTQNNNIKVGVFDSSIHLNHNDNSNIELISNENKKQINKVSHGTAVSSLISATKNKIGIRGITNSKIYFYSWSEQNLDLEKIFKKFKKNGVKIINISGTISSYAQKISRNENLNSEESYLASNDFIEVKKEYDAMRKIIKKFPSILFVMSSGNASHIGKNGGNGLLHYEYNEYENPKKLENLIIVAANDQDNILHGYSNYGVDVDISAPSAVATLNCTNLDNNNESLSLYYRYTNNKEKYGQGYSEYKPQETSNKEINCANINGAFAGTSASAPIVSGVASLIWNLDPTIKASKIRDIIINNGLNKKATKRWKKKFSLFNNNIYHYTDMPTGSIPLLNAKASYDKMLELIKEDKDEYPNFQSKDISSDTVFINNNIYKCIYMMINN